MINKDVSKSLACKNLIEILIWSWNNPSDTERVFRADGFPITTLMAFKCIGRILMTLENEWPVVVGNLR